MTATGVPPWLEWAREIQSLGQTGLVYSDNDYDVQRYRRLVEIAAEMTHAGSGLDTGRLLADFFAQQGYATPKVDVRGAVSRGGEILLVQERADGRWCMLVAGLMSVTDLQRLSCVKCGRRAALRSGPER